MAHLIKGLDLAKIQPAVEGEGDGGADHLGDGKAPPHIVYIPSEAQQIGDRQQNEELTAQ